MNNSLSELINHATQCLIDLGLSPETIKCYQCSAFHPLERKLENQKKCRESICRRFLKSLTDNGITSFEDIQAEHVRNFIVKISETRSKSMDDVIYTLRTFFCYLCENDLYHDNFWMLLAAPRCRDHHVRNCLSSEEISLLLGCIGRESSDGKRDFAAMYLASGDRWCNTSFSV